MSFSLLLTSLTPIRPAESALRFDSAEGGSGHPTTKTKVPFYMNKKKFSPAQTIIQQNAVWQRKKPEPRFWTCSTVAALSIVTKGEKEGDWRFLRWHCRVCLSVCSVNRGEDQNRECSELATAIFSRIPACAPFQHTIRTQTSLILF